MSMHFLPLYKNIIDEIHQAEHIMLVMHRRPDGDTAGACLAMSHYLDILGKPHTCFCVDELSPALRFLPGHQKITTDSAHWDPQTAAFNLIIVFDSSDLNYCGIAEYVDQLTPNITIINIDHHATNKQYGHHNLVVTDASSTCEIVHNLLQNVGQLNKHIATCLLTGLITDTGGFTNLATTATAIEAAAQLLLRGANFRQVTHHTIHNRSVRTLQLWGRALERLSISPSGIVSTIITQNDLQECGVDPESAEGVANFLNTIDQQQNAKATLVLIEQANGTIKGSIRTTHPLIDVSKLAMLFGGGGHIKAAGFTINGIPIEHNGRWIIQSTNEQ